MTKKKVLRDFTPNKFFLNHPKHFLQLLPQNFTPLPKILGGKDGNLLHL